MNPNLGTIMIPKMTKARYDNRAYMVQPYPFDQNSSPLKTTGKLHVSKSIDKNANDIAMLADKSGRLKNTREMDNSGCRQQ